MKTSIWLMIASVLFFVLGSILMIMGHSEIFGHPICLTLLGLVGVANLWCAVRQRLRWHIRYLGFVLCHIGVVVILIGAVLGFVYSDRVFFSLPVDGSIYYGQLPRQDNTMVELTFGVNISEFHVERYKPNYALYKPDDTKVGDYVFVREVKRQLDDTYYMGDLGNIDSRQLQNFQYEDGYVEQYDLDNGYILYKTPGTDKHYIAKMNIMDQSGKMKQEELRVNYPVTYKGWRFYLMSYDRQFGQYVVLSGRYDPGRYLVIGGIWMTIIGTGILCFWNKRGEVKPCMSMKS